MSINNDISVDDIMHEIHNYGERGGVESTLESVLTLLHDKYPDIYVKVTEYILDTEAAEEDSWVEGSGDWYQLKIDDEVEMRPVMPGEIKRYTIRHIIRLRQCDNKEDGLIFIHEVDYPAWTRTLCKSAFEHYLIKHWVRG